LFHVYSFPSSHVAILFTPVFTATVFTTNIMLTYARRGLKRQRGKTGSEWEA